MWLVPFHFSMDAAARLEGARHIRVVHKKMGPEGTLCDAYRARRLSSLLHFSATLTHLGIRAF
jgi:hypothetical protein